MRLLIIALLTYLAFSNPNNASAQGKSALVKESFEYVIKKFTKETGEIGSSTLLKKMETIAIDYGDDGISAIRKVGPSAIKIIDEAGPQGLEAVKLMAKHGDNAIWVVGAKNRLAIFIKYGDDAAEAMIKHKEVVEGMLNSLGKPAAVALKEVSTQNGRRLVIMSKNGDLEKIGKTAELLDVVAKYGDKGMDFIWKNKGALTVGSTLGAFLLNPEPFLANTIGKVGDIPGQVASEVSKKTNWTLVIIVGTGILGIFASLKLWFRHLASTKKNQSEIT